MAIARGAGTEIIRSAHFEDCDSTEQILIFGDQHHIYTVLSVIIYCDNKVTDTTFFNLYIEGYDSKTGDSQQDIMIARQNIPEVSTFVWENKFSFNGTEPTDFGSPPLSTVAEQDLIADQATATAQKLCFTGNDADDRYEITVTFIDQNNA